MAYFLIGLALLMAAANLFGFTVISWWIVAFVALAPALVAGVFIIVTFAIVALAASR